MSAGTSFARPAEEADPDGYIPDAVQWAYDATWPPLHWLLDEPDPVPAVLERWMARESSEASIRRAVILLREGQSAGGFIALPGGDVPGCRHADTRALVAEASRGARAEMARRLRAAAELHPPVEPDAYYLSRIGLSQRFRGHGLGRPLMEAFLEAGRSQGFRRFALDVRPDNSAAVRLYESAGFRSAQSHSAEGMHSMSMIRED